MTKAIGYEFKQAGFKAGKYTVGYQSCDDSTAQAGAWDSAKCASNARAYAGDSSVIGVVGTLLALLGLPGMYARAARQGAAAERAAGSSGGGGPVCGVGLADGSCRAGSGGGGGGGGPADSGGGVGYGVRARPVGAFVIKDGEVRWEPAIDATRLALRGMLIPIVGMLVAQAARSSAAAGRIHELLVTDAAVDASVAADVMLKSAAAALVMWWV